LSLLHSSINMRLSLVSRALGRAFLAFCLPDEQEIILGLIGQSSDAEDQAAGDLPAIKATLAEVRARGYALRNPTIRPISNTLALPIYEDQRVVASFGLTWFSSALSLEEARLTLYPAMKSATDDISVRLKTLKTSSKAPGVPV
jgi:IclR family mhp operon transcriptional activator